MTRYDTVGEFSEAPSDWDQSRVGRQAGEARHARESTSIFWLLFRLAAEIRQEFAFDDEKRWAERFGVLKTTLGGPQ